MKFSYNTKLTLPKQSKRSRSVLQDGSRSLGLFWKKKTLSYNRRNTVIFAILPNRSNSKSTRLQQPACQANWCFDSSENAKPIISLRTKDENS